MKLQMITLSLAISSTASSQEIGRWCDTIIPNDPSRSAIIEIDRSGDEGEVTITFADGSEITSTAKRKRNTYYLEDEFGTRLRVGLDGELAIFDREGFVRSAKRAAKSDVPGDCGKSFFKRAF